MLKTEDDLIFERHISKLSVYDTLAHHNANPGEEGLSFIVGLEVLGLSFILTHDKSYYK